MVGDDADENYDEKKCIDTVQWYGAIVEFSDVSAIISILSQG